MRRRDEPHLVYVRSLRCSICKNNIETQAAHIRMADARIAKPLTGIGIKPDDRFALPLCNDGHRKQHAMGERRFWSLYKFDPILIALALYSVSGDHEAGEAIIGGLDVTGSPLCRGA